MQPLFDQRQAAAFLKLSPRTLERHRTDGTGPLFVRLGRLVRYRETDLRAWVEKAVRTSTSDQGVRDA
jgi:predicted DNA-binding transcriptional regulator AlpA